VWARRALNRPKRWFPARAVKGSAAALMASRLKWERDEKVGFGRTVALYYRSSVLYRIL
jgi:hypothetical protein